MGESTYFIGFMMPTFGIICKLGGFCGPFGPRVWKFAFFDIILLKLKNLPSMSPALKVACPQSRLPSKSSALKVVCPQRRGLNVAALNVACPQCPIGGFIAGICILSSAGVSPACCICNAPKKRKTARTLPCSDEQVP